MRLTESLDGLGKPIVYYPSLAKIIGVKETIFLCQILFWAGKGPDGWIYRTLDQIEDETGLSQKEIRRIRHNLSATNLLEQKHDPSKHKLFLRPKLDEINDAWEKKEKLEYPNEEGVVAERASTSSCPKGKDYLPKGQGLDLSPNVRTESTEDNPSGITEVNSPLEVQENQEVLELLKAWEITEFPYPRLITAGRKKVLKARFSEKFFRENWREALARICESTFCKGQNDRRWTASFDWFLKPETLTRILEGLYDPKRRGPNL